MLGVFSAVGSGVAQAAYPDKPVKYIIPFAPGGESDIAARFQQIVFRKKFGQEMIIESKPGAGGALAWTQTNTFPGDGYTWMSTNLPHIVLQPLEGQVQYKTEDLANVCFYHYTPDAIVVRSESAVQDLSGAGKGGQGRGGQSQRSGLRNQFRQSSGHRALQWRCRCEDYVRSLQGYRRPGSLAVGRACGYRHVLRDAGHRAEG